MKRILKSLNSWLDIYRKPEESLLSDWFENLYSLLQNEGKKGNISEKIWYQKGEEMELTDIPNNFPLYKIKTLVLPQVNKDKRKYQPQLSEVTLISDIIPEGTPDIETWRLNLSLFDEKVKNIWPEIIFSRFRYSQLSDNRGKLEISQKHEINFRESRDLTLYEVKFIKSIFDKALT
ncbi:hypothetical protein A3J20_03410 [Candidatus Gottesmanbacteria bacterium RIFCSPLOWO2_02_FULL_42_29]|uniref:Uncharacterized protein n=2 Tax=Candidatus Gottesmaniibacteriota TaxID=1752720 RepID=A0A1F6BDM1_9BACT|nr:MAG: hypothetical protein UV09_C0002G0048 [Candidatus Gottesmanbacteria bacterium GW2011_GWA2_42_18]OGG12224.1 MAG: hypothetical protein A2781_04895 [Candidatus Gottesmanbacteria bacterium RIFCSPHIGHO2_01_FULL_42_27]OGG21712.1 MAG: hypothetical protein A3E72_04560 [Candidatus Gottesmanbacteria bacterium RIFCSPHIGHO2_12_FULL_43_26]OGG35049.1 MAG: hypothetical protein A2968_00260 [Candidatus Gottesmanbacteria bacterium RIFCSPLOWO2_01_FULL_42_22]OGG35808.1 MAG: hypothetical protein A3G68_05630 